MGNTMRKSAIFNVALLGAGHFFSDFYANFLPALIPLVMTKLEMSLTVSGMLVMAYSVISSILQPVAGYLIDKYGYAWLILVTTPVSAVFICLAALADNQVTLFILVGLAGLGASIFHPLAACLMGKVVTAETKGTAMAVFIFGGNVGFASAPAIILYCLNVYGTTSLLWLIIPGLLVAVAAYLTGQHKINIGSAATRGQHQQAKQAAPWYKSRGLLLLNAVNALRSWMQVVLPTFLPVALAAQGQPPAVIASMLTVFLMSGASGALFGGWIGDRLGRKTVVLASLLMSLPVTYLFLSDLRPSPVSYLLLGASGMLIQSTVPTSVVWAQELIPGNAAMASGMMLGLSFGLGGVGAAITGALADHIGLEAAMQWSLVSIIVATVLAFAIPQPQKNAIAPRVQVETTNNE